MTQAARRLRIAVLTRTFSPVAGGAERYSVELVEKLAARHDIHVFAQSTDHFWPGVTYHRVSMPMRKPRWINQLWFAAVTWWKTRKGFDVVHSHENTWHGQVQTVHVLPLKHNLFTDLRGWRRGFRLLKVLTSPRLLAYLWLERMRYLPKRDRVIVVISDTLRSIFSRAYPAARSMTSILTPGIDLPVFPVGPVERIRAREQLGLPVDRPCVLFAGNDFRKKGLETVFEAMALLSQDTVLAVAGDSAQRADFEQRTAQAGLVTRVFFLGSLKDMAVAYRAADVLVHATREDTFAMVVLEAMAHGLPVVVSGAAFCGVAGFLTPDVNALILDDPRDVKAVAQAVSRLLGEEVLRKNMGLAARQFAEGYEWAGIAAMQEKIYQAVASGLQPGGLAQAP